MVRFQQSKTYFYNDFTRLLYVRLWLLAMNIVLLGDGERLTGRVEHFTGHGRGFTVQAAGSTLLSVCDFFTQTWLILIMLIPPEILLKLNETRQWSFFFIQY